MNVRRVSYTKIDEDFKTQAIGESKEQWKQNGKNANDFIEPEFSSVLDLVAFCARVSNPANQINEQTSEKLVRYLVKHAHWSPLEMVDVTLEIDTTRDMAHQIVRHVSFRFQEFSQRYKQVDALGEDMFEFSEFRIQDTENRQNSISVNDPAMTLWWLETQKEVAELSKKRYQEALKRGVAKELARKILPEGLTKTRLYMKGSIRSWIHYCDLRSANGTQKEHMLIAQECAKTINEIFPVDIITR